MGLFTKNETEAKEEALNLMSGESYIMFNNLKGSIVVWINCDKEMQVKMTLDELKKAAYSLFPQLNISDLLFYLSRGDYVYTDKLTVRPLHPRQFATQSLIPSLKDVTRDLNKQKNRNLYF